MQAAQILTRATGASLHLARATMPDEPATRQPAPSPRSLNGLAYFFGYYYAVDGSGVVALRHEVSTRVIRRGTVREVKAWLRARYVKEMSRRAA